MDKNDSPPDEQIEYTFHPDSAIKKYLMEISPPRLIAMINEILQTSYPTDCDVSFACTEFFTITGNLEKNSRRCDLLVQMKDVSGTTDQHHKTLIELQSTKDDTMGFRLFVYALNVSDEDQATQTYTLPNAFTIYTTLDVPEKGFDQATFVSPSGETLFTYEAPFYNVLATNFPTFDKSPLALLKPLYLYRYRKNHKLLKKTEELKAILQNLNDSALLEEGPDRLVVCGLLADLFIDMAKICEKEGYKEELEMMETMNMTYSQTLIAKGMLEGEARGEARGEEKGEKKARLNIAKNLLDILDNTMISMKTGLTIGEIEKLRAES